jgi:hypothetical protein
MREDSLPAPSIAQLVAEILRLRYGPEFSLPFAQLQADAGYLNLGDIEKEIRGYDTLSYSELRYMYELELGKAKARAHEAKSAEPTVNGSGIPPAATSDGTVRAIRLMERNDVLSPFIEAAMKQCRDPNNASEAWVHLAAFARQGTRPFLEASEGEIKYLNAEDEVKFLNVDSLRKRMRRRNPR